MDTSFLYVYKIKSVHIFYSIFSRRILIIINFINNEIKTIDTAAIIAFLIPKATKFSKIIIKFVTKIPIALSIRKYFSNKSSGTVTPPFEAPTR